MTDSMWRVPEVTKKLDLPVDSAIGLKVKLQIGDVLGLFWTGYWSISNTALGEFELKVDESSLCSWKFVAQLEIKLTGDGQTPELNFKNDVEFSQRVKQWKLDPIEEGRKYNKIELKLTRKAVIGIRQEEYINFDNESTWLDVKIRDKDKTMEVYANSGILALNSPLLRERFEKYAETNKDGKPDIIIPSSMFPALKKLLNFLHPPFAMEKENVGKVLELAHHWGMSQVLGKYEEFLTKQRSFGPEATVKNIKLAEKFKMKNLLEEILWNDASCVYKLLQENCFSTWTRAAMFEFILEIEDEENLENHGLLRETVENEDEDEDDDADSSDSDDSVDHRRDWDFEDD